MIITFDNSATNSVRISTTINKTMCENVSQLLIESKDTVRVSYRSMKVNDSFVNVNGIEVTNYSSGK